MRTQSFSLTAQDLEALQAAAAARSRAVRAAALTQKLSRLSYVLVAVFAVGYAVLRRANAPDDEERTRWLLVAFGALAFFGVGALLSALAAGRSRRTQLELGRDLVYELTPEGVAIRHARGVAVTPWTELEAAELTPAHVILYLRGGGASVVPLRAFPDAASADAFTAEARSRISR